LGGGGGGGRIYELENRLLATEGLDPAIARSLRDWLNALAVMGPDDYGGAKEVELWQRIRAAAPTLWENLGAPEH
jgi:hypothetical protein